MARIRPDTVFCMDRSHNTPCMQPCMGCEANKCDRRRRKKFKNFDKRSQQVIREHYRPQYRAVKP